MTECRACGATRLQFRFQLILRGAHEARYFECQQCRTLQVASPDWLGDAHRQPTAYSDVGAVQRCIETRRTVRWLLRTGAIDASKKLLDFGSGSGLLVRLLRDSGFDAWALEPFRTPELAGAFALHPDQVETSAYSVITAIEVFEHLVEPAETLRSLKALLAPTGALLVTTVLYDPNEHGADWWYLDQANGEHVTLYTVDGLKSLARRLGLTFQTDGRGIHLLGTRLVSDRRWRVALKMSQLESRFLQAIGADPGWTMITRDVGRLSSP